MEKLQSPKNKTAQIFVEYKSQFKGKHYLFCIIAYHLAPVLERARPSVLISFSDSRRNMLSLWNKYSKDFPASEKLQYLEVRHGPHNISVLFYNPEMINDILQKEKILHFLKNYGYSGNMTISNCLTHLKTRFYQAKCPQEIGLLLGIPLEDVIGFIKNNGKYYKLCGYWKVYDNPVKARQVFQSYEIAKSRYLMLLHCGVFPYEFLQYYSCK